MRRSRSILLAAARTIVALVLVAPTTTAGDPTQKTREVAAPRIWMPQWRAESESIRIEGRDPFGSRRLELHVWRGGKFVQLGARHSDARGYFDFGFWPVPTDALLLVVTPAGQRPRLDQRSRIERPLAAPLVSVSAVHGARAVSIHPAHPEGELRVVDPRTGATLDRIVLDADSDSRGSTSIDFIARIGPRAPTFVLVRQILPDGRASEAAFLSLSD